MRTLLATAILLSSLPTLTQAQALIPSPYPTGVTGATPLDPEPPDQEGPQRLLRDPYPQLQGEFAQGNPPVSRRHRHQHLVPSTYKRRYRVEKHGGAE